MILFYEKKTHTHTRTSHVRVNTLEYEQIFKRQIGGEEVQLNFLDRYSK